MSRVAGPRWVLLPAVLGPLALTVVLTRLPASEPRDYTFLYLAVVAALGLSIGLGPSLLAAAVSFLCVDWFFVPPLHTLTISDATDLLNLLAFFGAAGLVGGLSSWRRRDQLRAERLARELAGANATLERLRREESEAARTAVRLAQSQQQVRALEEADHLRRELLQNVSHELRTPLATILTGTTAMLDSEDVSERWRESAAGIVSQARRLDRLVGDMLDMARIEGGALELQLEPLSLADAATAAADRLRRLSPGRTVEVTSVPGTADAVGDWDRVGQVLDNLLANADRFAPLATPIEVRVAPGARDMVLTEIRDHGPGVAPELSGHLFERFVSRVDVGGGGQTVGSGTGLGLAIVRGLVEAQAGRVWLEDVPEGETGARFLFTLPAAPRPEPP